MAIRVEIQLLVSEEVLGEIRRLMPTLTTAFHQQVTSAIWWDIKPGDMLVTAVQFYPGSNEILMEIRGLTQQRPLHGDLREWASALAHTWKGFCMAHQIQWGEKVIISTIKSEACWVPALPLQPDRVVIVKRSYVTKRKDFSYHVIMRVEDRLYCRHDGTWSERKDANGNLRFHTPEEAETKARELGFEIVDEQ